MSSWLKMFCCLLVLSISAIGFADDERPATPKEPVPAKSLEGFQLQDTDEPLQKFVPKTPKSAAENNLADALSWYMTGRLQQERKDIDAAIRAYQKAIELDSKSIDSYQAIIPLLLQDRKTAEARDLSLKAAQHSPRGYDLILTMATLFARSEQLSESTKLIEEALALPTLEKGSLYELMLRRDNGLYLRLRGDDVAAAEQYRLVFDAVTSDDVSEDVKKKILSNPGRNFDEFGDVFVKAKLPELALRAYEEASKHREAKPGLHSFNLAAVFQQTGKPNEALSELQKYFDSKSQSRGRAPYDLFKELLEETKQADTFVERMKSLYESDPQNDVLRFYLAESYLDNEELAAAEELYDKGAESDPRTILGQFSIKRRGDDPEQLLESLIKAFRTIPRSEDEVTLQKLAPDVRSMSTRFETDIKGLSEDEAALDRLYGYARKLEPGDKSDQDEFFQVYVLGKMAAEAKRTDDVNHFYRKAIDMRNDPPAILYRELGLYLMDEELYDDAITVLTEAAKHPSSALQSEKWRFLFFLSYAYQFNGETDEALVAVRQAQKLQSRFARLYYQEAWIFYHNREWEESLRLFEEVMKKYKSDRDLVQDCRFRVSNIYVELGNMEKGEQILEDVLKEDPDNTQANNDLGYLWIDHDKNLDRGRAMIEKALKAEPDNPAYLDSMGWVLFKHKEYAEAKKHLIKASQHENGEDSTIFDHLGDVLDKLGESPEAMAAWKKALEIEEEKKAPSEEMLKKLRGKVNPEAALEKEASGTE